jgi:hypothetical protein
MSSPTGEEDNIALARTAHPARKERCDDVGQNNGVSGKRGLKRGAGAPARLISQQAAATAHLLTKYFPDTPRRLSPYRGMSSKMAFHQARLHLFSSTQKLRPRRRTANEHDRHPSEQARV